MTASRGRFGRTMKLYPLVLLLAACATDLDLGSTEQDVISTNGRSLNGTTLNGRSLNGRSLNGRSLNGISLNGVSLNGRSLNGVALSGSQLTATGTTLVGATLTGILDDGAALQLRVDSATALPAPNADVWAYGISYPVGDGTWASVCGPNTLAIPLAGVWNYASGVAGGGAWTASTTSFTLGCRGTALAKCVELGYKPWNNLRAQHQACTRMLRADYCGDGTSYTFNGWTLNVFDNLGIQKLAPGYSDYTFEAHWGANGALCMSSYRALDLIVSTDLPACVVQRTSDACTDNGFGDGSVLQDYYDPWSLEVALSSAYATYPSAKAPLQLAMLNISQAMTYVSKSDIRNAAVQVQLAVTNLKLAISNGLPAAFSNDLMRRYSLLIRAYLVNAIAAAKPGLGLTLAAQNLAKGDALAAKPDYPLSVDQYKLGIWAL